VLAGRAIGFLDRKLNRADAATARVSGASRLSPSWWAPPPLWLGAPMGRRLHPAGAVVERGRRRMLRSAVSPHVAAVAMH